MNFSWGSDPDSFSWSQRTWKQGDLIWNCSRTMKQDDTRESTIVSIRSIFAKMMTYHKVSVIQKWRQDFPLVSGITAGLSLCFLLFHMDHECQKRQSFNEKPAKLLLNPHYCRYEPLRLPATISRRSRLSAWEENLMRPVMRDKQLKDRSKANEPSLDESRRLWRLFRVSVEHILYRRAYRLIRAVNTAHPTARSTHSLFQFRAHSLNMLLSGFRLFHGDCPAYPFIARKRS